MYPSDFTPPTRPLSSASVRRPSSSASTRAPTTLPSRPSSSASIRPSTSASLRPASSASYVTRPPTSLSSRPSSRLTHRAPSRFSVRPPTRQSSRLIPHYQKLVTLVTGITLEEDEDNFRIASEYVARCLDQTVKPSGSVDMGSVRKHFKGLVQKAHIMSQDTHATALETAFKTLMTQMKERPSDLDAEINSSRLPHHLQFLLFLSCSPDQSTLTRAETYLEELRNPPKPAEGLTWKSILAEEPFSGQHWEGVYGLPSGSTVEGWETKSIESSPSLSPFDDDDDLDDTDSQASSDPRPISPLSTEIPQARTNVDGGPSVEERFAQSFSHLDVVEDLQKRQFWRSEWRLNVPVDRSFDLGDASTIGPAFRRLLSSHMGSRATGMVQDKYIYEHDAVREILFGLQGRRNLMISWYHEGENPQSFCPSSDAPRLQHITETALHSILSSFAQTATTLQHLRKFVSAVFTKSSHHNLSQPSHTVHTYRRSTRTLEALCESIDHQIRLFDTWCASKEESLCLALMGVGPPLVISLLSLEVSIRDEFAETYNVLLDLVRKVVQRATRSSEPILEIWTLPDLPTRISPSSLTSLLLDSLLKSMREYATMGDVTTSQALFSVFASAAEPVWMMIGKWLKDGMPIREASVPVASSQEGQYQYQGNKVDEEFFIEDNELGLFDSDFWTDGFVLRGGSDDGGAVQPGEGRSSAVPTFLAQASSHILSAGKAVGLLRVLGLSSLLDGEDEKGRWLVDWPSFRTILRNSHGREGMSDGEGQKQEEVVSISVDDFASFVYEEVVPMCKKAQEVLSQVLTEECDLWLHLSAMEDLFLMRRGDAIANLIDTLFARMDSQYPWTDFHFLNSAFRDIVDAGQTHWIDPSLVRLSHRGNKDKPIRRTVRAIEGLLIEYAIRRAKNVLERILVRNALENANVAHMGGELKVFYAMRGKLSWFVNALLNFISTNVLHTQVLAFHTALKTARSLDDMIALHEAHLERLEGRCLLQKNTVALHRSVISILDMTLHFADCFVAFAGDSTLDISRQSLILMKRHRSRRLKRQRKNIIGFSQSILAQTPDSSSDSEDEERENGMSLEAGAEPSFSLAASTSISFVEESFYVRVDKMSMELDALVRFVRRGVESLAGGAGEAASTFGIFAFALEDWDR